MVPIHLLVAVCQREALNEGRGSLHARSGTLHGGDFGGLPIAGGKVYELVGRYGRDYENRSEQPQSSRWFDTNDDLKKTAKLLSHTYVYPQYSFGIPTKSPQRRRFLGFSGEVMLVSHCFDGS